MTPDEPWVTLLTPYASRAERELRAARCKVEELQRRIDKAVAALRAHKAQEERHG